MPKYIIVHHKDSEFVSFHINHACKVCAKEKKAVWRRTFHNLKEGKTFCEWEADSKNVIKETMDRCKLPYGEIVEVEEIIPDECVWEIFGKLED